MGHRTVNWNLFARLSITINQRPSSYNIRMFWYKFIWSPCPFLSVHKEWQGYGESFPPRGVTASLGANVQEVTHDGESFTPLTLEVTSPAKSYDAYIYLLHIIS